MGRTFRRAALPLALVAVVATTAAPTPARSRAALVPRDLLLDLGVSSPQVLLDDFELRAIEKNAWTVPLPPVAKLERGRDGYVTVTLGARFVVVGPGHAAAFQVGPLLLIVEPR